MPHTLTKVGEVDAAWWQRQERQERQELGTSLQLHVVPRAVPGARVGPAFGNLAYVQR